MADLSLTDLMGLELPELDRRLTSLSIQSDELSESIVLLTKLERELSNSKLSDPQKSLFYSNLAFAYRRNDQRTESLEACSRSDGFLTLDSNQYVLGRLREEEALIHRLLEPVNLDKALGCAERSLFAYEAARTQAKIARLHGIIGQIYIERGNEGDLSKAEPHAVADLGYQERLAAEGKENKPQLANAYHGLGKLHRNLGHNLKAIAELSKALSIYELIEDKSGIINVQADLSLAAARQRNASLSYVLNHLKNFNPGDILTIKPMIKEAGAEYDRKDLILGALSK